MLSETIKSFNKQFLYKPEIKGGVLSGDFKKFIVLGMGGSHLAADILKAADPFLDVIIHKNYGLPSISKEELRQRLIIANSYSGNTEEVIDGFKKTIEMNLAAIAISVNGKLIELAKENNIPYIQMPDVGLESRFALGYSVKAVLKAMSKNSALNEISDLARSLNPSDFEAQGKEIAQKLKNKIPNFYSSEQNSSIAYIWRIKMNETAKIPAFSNVFPELNHNEIEGFGSKIAEGDLSKNFHFVFIKDSEDDLKIQKRMELLKKLYEEKGLALEEIELKGESRFLKIFSSLVLADWTSLYLAEESGIDAIKTPTIENFKKLMAEDIKN